MRYVVDRKSGLLKEATATTEKGRLHFVMREGHVGEPLDSELVTLPEEARRAPESPEIAGTLVQRLASERDNAFARVEFHLSKGTREWNALARRDWETVLDALHREPITRGTAKMLTELRKGIPGRAERARKDRGEEGSQERKVWEQRVAESSANLEASLGQAETRYRESIGTLDLPDEPRQELLDIETEVLDALWAELVRDPMLALFDESFAEAAK